MAEEFSPDLVRVMSALRPTLTLEGDTHVGWFHPEPEHRGNPGWLHGGLAATVLDHVTARAASWFLGDVPVVTGTLDLKYRAPVPLADGPFRVRSSVDAGRVGRYARVRGAILGHDGAPLVEATALFVPRPGG